MNHNELKMLNIIIRKVDEIGTRLNIHQTQVEKEFPSGTPVRERISSLRDELRAMGLDMTDAECILLRGRILRALRPAWDALPDSYRWIGFSNFDAIREEFTPDRTRGTWVASQKKPEFSGLTDEWLFAGGAPIRLASDLSETFDLPVAELLFDRPWWAYHDKKKLAQRRQSEFERE